jgi:hypothetical protein
MGGGERLYRVLVGKPERKRSLGIPRHGWGMILRRIFRKWNVGIWTELSWLRIETGGGHL